MSRLKILRILEDKYKGIKKTLFLLALLKICKLILEIIPLFLYSFFINYVLIGTNIEIMVYIICGYMLVYIFMTAEIIYSKKIFNKLKIKIELKIKSKLLKKYLKEKSKKELIGDIRYRIENDSITTVEFLESHILNFIYEVVYSVILALVLLCFDFKISIISFIFIPISLFLMNLVGKKVQNSKNTLRDLQTKYETFLFESFHSWKDIKINNLENDKFEHLNDFYSQLKKPWFTNSFFIHIGETYSFFTKNFITKVFIYFIGGIFVILGYSELSVLLIFIKFYARFFECIQNIGDSIVNFKNDSINIAKVIEVITEKSVQLPKIKIKNSHVEVDNLTYKYSDNAEFKISNVSFKIKSGDHLAIIGESGSGKSTLIKLLIGQLRLQNGKIYIGGVDINGINKESILEKVSIVSQDPIMFNITIRENLLLAKPNATEKELIECCCKANIYPYILTLPKKWDTVIGEKGVKFSGGQKQRLSIARAFLQNRDIIIFDESTSALDIENEREIIKQIDNLSKGKTLISISHRYSSIKRCNKVLVLNNGSVDVFDTHENVKKKNELYKKMFKSE